jgi:CubicO group peptidase (beta-lactamase class C family)
MSAIPAGGMRRAVPAAVLAVVLVASAGWYATRPGPAAAPQAETAAAPAETGLDAVTLAAAATLVEAGVGHAYPGATLAVGAGAALERVAAFGRIGWREASPPVIADSTLYDLASLTKAMAATTAVLLLVQDGRIALDEPVRRHLPAFEGQWKDEVTWRHLLTHTSGLPAGAAIRGSTPEERLRRILRTKLGVPPGRQMVYSDVGYVALWAAAEKAAGEPLPEMLRRRVWQPLGMDATQFSPGRDCMDCAPTLRLKTGEPFRGLPSDLLARELGGTAGNAGLFATIGDVARFTAMIAGGGAAGNVRILDEALVAEMLRQQPGAGRRTLGWTAFCPDDEATTASTPCASPVAYGHTGWSGTSLWVEPQNGRWVVLLTNRSYERPNRPFPLDGLRRDVFYLVAGLEQSESDGWLARATPPVEQGPRDRVVAPPRRGSPAR